MQRSNQEALDVRPPLVFVGVGLILVSVVALLYLAWVVLQVFRNPEEVQLIQFLTEKIEGTDHAISGSLGDQQFDVRLGDPIKHLLFLFMGAVILSIVASIFRGIIRAGIELIRFGSGGDDLKRFPIAEPVKHDLSNLMKKLKEGS